MNSLGWHAYEYTTVDLDAIAITMPFFLDENWTKIIDARVIKRSCVIESWFWQICHFIFHVSRSKNVHIWRNDEWLYALDCDRRLFRSVVEHYTVSIVFLYNKIFHECTECRGPWCSCETVKELGVSDQIVCWPFEFVLRRAINRVRQLLGLTIQALYILPLRTLINDLFRLENESVGWASRCVVRLPLFRWLIKRRWFRLDARIVSNMRLLVLI